VQGFLSVLGSATGKPLHIGFRHGRLTKGAEFFCWQRSSNGWGDCWSAGDRLSSIWKGLVYGLTEMIRYHAPQIMPGCLYVDDCDLVRRSDPRASRRAAAGKRCWSVLTTTISRLLVVRRDALVWQQNL